MTSDKSSDQSSFTTKSLQDLVNNMLANRLLMTTTLGAQQRAYWGFMLMDHLLRCMYTPEQDPCDGVLKFVERVAPSLELFDDLEGLQELGTQRASAGDSSVKQTEQLFEEAWTLYSNKTYDHSVDLIVKRLQASGVSQNAISDTVCFDGGCGTGRFAIALAKLGAKHVVAADIGGRSLSFAREKAEALKINCIEFVEQDVTDLSAYADGHFDLVVSNGVLHHTTDPLGGVKEHYRVTKSKGLFWLYLYGKGGMYWPCFDIFKQTLLEIPVDQLKAMLMSAGIREGLVYTYLDNFRAPIREYYSLQDLSTVLPLSDVKWRYQGGEGLYDDMDKFLATAFGKTIFGPEGELRLVIEKP